MRTSLPRIGIGQRSPNEHPRRRSPGKKIDCACVGYREKTGCATNTSQNSLFVVLVLLEGSSHGKNNQAIRPCLAMGQLYENGGRLSRKFHRIGVSQRGLLTELNHSDKRFPGHHTPWIDGIFSKFCKFSLCSGSCPRYRPKRTEPCDRVKQQRVQTSFPAGQ